MQCLSNELDYNIILESLIVCMCVCSGILAKEWGESQEGSILLGRLPSLHIPRVRSEVRLMWIPGKFSQPTSI